MAIAERLGFMVMPAPSTAHAETAPALLQAFSRLTDETGEVFARFNESVADGRISAHEVDAVERAIWQMVQGGLSLTAQMRAQVILDARKPPLQAVA